MTPDAIRKKNFVQPKQLPYKTATGKIYDSGDFAAHMKRAMEVANWKDFPKRAKAAKKAGLVRGIGMSSYVEICGTMGDENANVLLDPNGEITVLVGTQSTGQGHHTAYAQIVAEQFGVSPERIHIHQGDTGEIPTGLGTGGSSSIPTGGVCVQRATADLGNKLKEVAAEALETSAGDLEINDGAVRIAGTDRSISFPELAKRPGVDPSKLRGSATFNSADGTYPNGTHIAEVEIDPATGIVKLVGYVIVDDFGATLNPLLLEGQVHGGVMQGIGQALMEQVLYSPDGQLMTGTYMDYALPRASDGVAFHFETHNIPCKTNPMGVKGAGEAGAIGSCPAVVNAIIDALWREYKIDHIDMPATPERVWIAIREHQRQHSL
jgi:carbon-monoxide dehydrogenase large subunit